VAAPDELYHVSEAPLDERLVLAKYDFGKREGQRLGLMRAALQAGPESVRALLFTDRWLKAAGDDTIKATNVLLELILELARLRVAPHLPSRWECVFALRSVEDARAYRQTYRPTAHIYRCELASGDLLTFDMQLASRGIDLAAPIADELRRLEERAGFYWRQVGPMAAPELLTTGTVVVRGVVDTP
jgi:hypothetical protein